MKLLRKLQPVSSTQFAVDSYDEGSDNNNQLVPVDVGGLKSKWSHHLHMPKLFKSTPSLSQADVNSIFMSGSLRRRKRDAIRQTFFRKSSHRDAVCDNNTPSFLVPVDLKDSEPEARSSTETECSWEEFDLEDCEQSTSDSDSELNDGIKGGFVFPPVIIPLGYRQQDRMGGVTVAGRRVLFTFAAFKRNSLKVSQLRTILEERHEDIDKSEPHSWPPSSALRRGYSRRGLYSSTDHNEWI
jgi:hypothetical protein